jgi:hypothetical protein
MVKRSYDNLQLHHRSISKLVVNPASSAAKGATANSGSANAGGIRKLASKYGYGTSKMNTSLGKVTQARTTVRLSNNNVFWSSNLPEAISNSVLNKVTLHVLAVIFPAFAIISMLYMAVKIVHVGVETYTLINDYKTGKATKPQIKKVVGDVVQTATDYIGDNVLTYHSSGNGVFTELTTDMIKVVAAQQASSFADYVAVNAQLFNRNQYNKADHYQREDRQARLSDYSNSNTS